MQAGHAISLVVDADRGAGVGVGETGTEAEWRRVAAAEKGRGLAAAETPPGAVLDGIGDDAKAEAELYDLARGTPQSVHLAVLGLWPGGLRKLQTSQIQLSPAVSGSMIGSDLEASGGTMWSVTFGEEVNSPA